MKSLKRQANSGFTLMEIMVVIIVIAVLASVAGPMIGNITDQGKASATRASMQNVKTALVNYNNDLGRFPHIGVTYNSDNINAADGNCLGPNVDKNVLVNENVATPFSNMNIAAYGKRWKGPYMDADPAEFMTDAWEAKLTFKYHNKQLWLHSKGPDGQDDFACAVLPNYNGDDIVMSVTRVKF